MHPDAVGQIRLQSVSKPYETASGPVPAVEAVSLTVRSREPATRRAYEIVRPLMSVDGRIDLDAFRFMQDTLLDLGVLKKRLPLEAHYTTEFIPVKV